MDDITLYANLNADEVKTTAEELQSDIEDIFNQSGGSTSPELNKMLDRLAQLYAKAESVKGRMADLENQTFPTDEFVNVSKEIDNLTSKVTRLQSEEGKLAEKQSQLDVKIPTDEYKAVQDQLIASQKEYDKLIEKRDKFISTGGNVKTKAFKQLQYDIDQLSNTIQYAKGELKDLEENEQAFKANPEYDKVSSQLSNIRTQISQVLTERDKLYQQKLDMQLTGQDTFSGVDTAEYDNLKNSLGGINNQIVTAIGRFDAGNGAIQRMGSSANSTSVVMQRLHSTVTKVALSMAKMPINITITAFKKLASAVKTVVSNMAKLASSGVKNAIGRLSSAIGGLGKNTEKSNVMFKRGFNTFIKYAFGVRSVYFLVRKLRTALIEGFGDLAKVSEPFNEAVSNMRTALRLLRNSIAAAFSPIIQVVSPIITRFITQMAEAVNKIGQMIAALTGQKTYMRAVAVYQDYAASLDKSSKNADKASKSTKKLKTESEKLKKTLAGFDDVEILKGPDDNGDDDNGYDLDGLTDELEDVEPPQWEETGIGEVFTNLSDLLKRAWEKADFTEVGAIIGQKLKAALENIPWTGIKKTLRKVGKSIATLLNGFLEVPGLFKTIGKTIAEGINSAFEFVEAFVSNFHWDSLGKAIKDLIFGVLDNIDWKLIYKTVREFAEGIGTTINEILTDSTLWRKIFTSAMKLIGAVLEGINTFLKTVKWSDIGKAISDGINAAIEKIDDLHIGKTLSKLINSLFQLAKSFVTNLHWGELGTQLKTLILEFLNGITWQDIYDTVKGFASGIGTAIQNGLNNEEILTAIFNAIGKLIGLIPSAINSFISSIDWVQFGINIGNALNNSILSFDWNSVTQTLIRLINDAFHLWYNFVTTFNFGKFGEKIGSMLADAINGINWTEGATAVAETLSGLLEALNGFLETTPFEDIGRKVAEVIATFLDTFDWGEFGSFLSNCIKGLADFLIGLVTDEQGNSLDIFEVGTQIASKIAEAMEGFDWYGVAVRILELMSNDFILALTNPAAFMGKKFGEFLADGIKGDWAKQQDQLTKAGIIDPTAQALTGNAQHDKQLKESGENVAEGVKEGIKDNWADIGDWSRINLKDPFVDGTNKAFDSHSPSKEMLPVGENVALGLKKGITDDLRNINSWIKSNVFNAFDSALKSAFNIAGGVSNALKYIGTSVVTGLHNGISNNWYSVLNMVTSNAYSLINAFNNIDWSSIGSNICSGISNGLSAGWGWLTESAWNLATDIFNSACNALDIGSPSKLFRNEVGKMIPAGMALGILDNEGLVENAMGTLTDTVANTGQQALKIPAVVKGSVVPYQATITSQTESALQDVVDALETNYTEQVTPDVLRDMLVEVISTYLDINFYLGDEQIARHANAGNVKLNRRFNKFGGA